MPAVAGTRRAAYRGGMTSLHPSQRLTIDLAAVQRNYRRLAAMGSGACGAAVKANAYGLGADRIVPALEAAGCRSFFVATLAEAAQVRAVSASAEIVLLHGAGPADIAAVRRLALLPVINTPQQAADWRGTGAPCAVMIDTGINRLGLGLDQLESVAGLTIDLLLSHLACADDAAEPYNTVQSARFRAAATGLGARRLSLANSGGILLGPDFHFDLTRPGIGLYGGLPGFETVIRAEALVLQRRLIRAGEPVGYGRTWTAPCDTPVATLGLGYADGYLRGFSGRGIAHWQGHALPLVGRVSMDLITCDASAAPPLAPGDWVTLIGPDTHLTQAAAFSGLTEYELLTTLGSRYQRNYRE